MKKTKIIFPQSFFTSLPGWLAVLFWMFTSCNSNERVDNSGDLAREIKSAQIKRITPAELAGLLNATGKKTAAKATESLHAAIESTGECADLQAKIDAATRQNGVEVELLYAKDTSNTTLFSKENDLLLAYDYQRRQEMPLSDNLQKINDTLTVYYAPLPTDSPLFQKCEEASGSAFAIWRVVLNQKEIIRTLDF